MILTTVYNCYNDRDNYFIIGSAIQSQIALDLDHNHQLKKDPPHEMISKWWDNARNSWSSFVEALKNHSQKLNTKSCLRIIFVIVLIIFIFLYFYP